MNLNQKLVVDELKIIAKQIGKSPTKREISSNLLFRCYKNFGSFNKAKKEGNLILFRVKNPKINKKLLKKDIDLVKIIGLINFDGHLSKDLSSFYYSSKNIKDIELFSNIIKQKFNVKSKIKKNTTGSKNQTHIGWIFNKNLSKELNNLGVINGDKITKPYLIPEWIIKNKKFSREFLKIAFFCEGTNKEEAGRRPRIRFGMNKSERLLENGINFINQLKSMLGKFDIKTTPIYISNSKTRKDGIKSKLLVFRIDQKDNNKFIKEIGWIK